MIDRSFLVRNKRVLVISLSVLLLQLLFGWDIKFTCINLIWLLV